MNEIEFEDFNNMNSTNEIQMSRFHTVAYPRYPPVWRVSEGDGDDLELSKA